MRTWGDLVSSALKDDRRARFVFQWFQPGSPTSCPSSFNIWQICGAGRLVVFLREVSSQAGLLCPKLHSAFQTSSWLSRSLNSTRISKCATRKSGLCVQTPSSFLAALPRDHTNPCCLLFAPAEAHGQEQPSPQSSERALGWRASAHLKVSQS